MTICVPKTVRWEAWRHPHSYPVLELLPCWHMQENVDMMAEYLPLENFKTIYVVDLCKSLCEQAKKKVDANGWKNVVVVEGDACTFKPPAEKVTLVTFSYSLSSESAHFKRPDKTSISLMCTASFERMLWSRSWNAWRYCRADCVNLAQ
jgi:hypothetical protein